MIRCFPGDIYVANIDHFQT